MPTYEYRCLSCGHEFEAFQRISEEPLTECSRCQKRVERQISGGLGVIFKGSGFYSTDHKKSHSAAGNTTADKKDADTTKQDPTKEPSPVTA